MAAGLSKKKVEPQFGVSFGLPYPSGAYPFNAINGGHPAQNPYFGSISPNGLNLGLVNVNPLVSFQFAKNDYGEKVFKPLVNLHVTPNENIINKVGALFKAKKQGLYGGQGGYGGYGQSAAYAGSYNQHYHTHTHIPAPPSVYHPHHFEGSQYSHGDFHSSSPTGAGHYGFSGHGGSPYGITGSGGSPYGITGSGGSPYGITGSGGGHYGATGSGGFGLSSPGGFGGLESHGGPGGFGGPGGYGGLEGHGSPSGFGLSGPGGYYREGSSFASSEADSSIDPHLHGTAGPSEYDYNGLYSRSLNTSKADGSESFIPSNNNGYANTYNNYNNQNIAQNAQNQNENQPKQSVSFPSSRRKRSSGNNNDEVIEKNTENTASRSVNIEKVR